MADIGANGLASILIDAQYYVDFFWVFCETVDGYT